MALIKCIECGKMFSEHAECCPECGCPIEDIKREKIRAKAKEAHEQIMKETKNTSMTLFIIAIIIVVIIAALSLLISYY